MKIDYLLITFCTGVFLTNANTSFMSAFFPSFAEGQGVGLDGVGIIFSAEPVGALICSLMLGRMMNKKGFKKLSIILGLIVQCLGLALMIILFYLKKDQYWFFFILALVARTI